MKVKATLLALSTMLLLLTPKIHAQKDLPTTGIRFWVERADAIRMPETYDADNYFNSYELGTNGFRGFTANGCHSNSEHGPNCYVRNRQLHSGHRILRLNLYKSGNYRDDLRKRNSFRQQY
ncbi:MAG TPA: hypothetical protein VFA99_19000 [Acidobacteriaceae bacterium]|nr:hypothetical protein [Acidobacteriaceae bacterium]